MDNRLFDSLIIDNLAVANAAQRSSHVPLPAFYEKLPPHAQSIFYGMAHYQQYRTVVLNKLAEVLKSTEFGYDILGKPYLMYSTVLGAFIYTIHLQFRNAHDPVMQHTVRERNEDIPTWIISLRQQMPYIDILPMSTAFQDALHRLHRVVESSSGVASGPAFTLLIDFRRVPPPNWEREIKAFHSLDEVVDVKHLVQRFPINFDTLEHYEAEMQDVEAFIENNHQQIEAQISAKAPIFQLSTRDILSQPLEKSLQALSPTEASCDQMFVSHSVQNNTLLLY